MRPLVHNTVSGYVSRRCRCSLCRIAWAAYIKRRRNTKRDAAKLFKQASVLAGNRFKQQ